MEGQTSEFIYFLLESIELDQSQKEPYLKQDKDCFHQCMLLVKTVKVYQAKELKSYDEPLDNLA